VRISEHQDVLSVILETVLKKSCLMWSGFIWLRIKCNSRTLITW